MLKERSWLVTGSFVALIWSFFTNPLLGLIYHTSFFECSTKTGMEVMALLLLSLWLVRSGHCIGSPPLLPWLRLDLSDCLIQLVFFCYFDIALPSPLQQEFKIVDVTSTRIIDVHLTESDHAQPPRLQSTGNFSMKRAYGVTICWHTFTLVYLYKEIRERKSFHR